jgi:NAD(P)H-hydrate epimerase
MRIHTAAELREIDRHAAQTLGIPAALLMENAGRAVALAAREKVGIGRRIAIVCGRGNNGGDGWVAARHLRAWEVPVSVLSLATLDELKGDARLNAAAALACGVPLLATLDHLGPGDVVVDAIFGTGLARPVDGVAAGRIRDIRAARDRGAYVVAVDLPSGLDGDRTQVPEVVVESDLTVTLHALKPALVQPPTRALAGEIRTADIGLPVAHAPGPERRFLERPTPFFSLPRRAIDAHKGTAGHVLVVAGTPAKSGAAALACRAALRSGAGLVTLASAPEVLDRVLPAMPEVMGFPLPTLDAETLLRALDRKASLVVGPGLEPTELLASVLVELLAHVAIATVVDADGLNALAAHPETARRLVGAQVKPILTPHPTECARLLGLSTPEIQADRLAAATEAARRFGAHVVLKGANSVVAHPDGSLEVNGTGNPAMATAGSGDVLAGVCGALLAQRIEPRRAAMAATWAHGRAGDLAAGGRDRGLVAGDLVERLPDALAELT